MCVQSSLGIFFFFFPRKTTSNGVASPLIRFQRTINPEKLRAFMGEQCRGWLVFALELEPEFLHCATVPTAAPPLLSSASDFFSLSFFFLSILFFFSFFLSRFNFLRIQIMLPSCHNRMNVSTLNVRPFVMLLDSGTDCWIATHRSYCSFDSRLFEHCFNTKFIYRRNVN